MPRLASTRINNQAILDLEPGAEIADSEIRGLYLRKSKSGNGATWTLRYRTPSGQRRCALGAWPGLTCNAAREAAKLQLASVAQGVDVSQERQAQRAELTVKDLRDLWLERIQVKPATRVHYEMRSRAWVAAFGSKKISDLTRSQIRDFYRGLTGAVSTRNQTIKSLRAMYQWAASEEIATVNPTTGVKMEVARGRERFLSADERRKLWSLLATQEKSPRAPQGTIDALRLLIHTGCRKEEILSLQWADIDLERGLLMLPDSKTGRSVRPLSPQALDLLREISARRRSLCPFVCVSRRGNRLAAIDQTWNRWRAEIGLDDVHVHDLRHALASDALAAGVSLAVIGKLLGHSSVSSTARYAHLSDDAGLEAAAKVGERIAAAHDQGDEIINLETARKNRK